MNKKLGYFLTQALIGDGILKRKNLDGMIIKSPLDKKINSWDNVINEVAKNLKNI